MSTLTQSYLTSRLSYDPYTGVFTWLPVPDTAFRAAYFNREFAGKEAGGLHVGSGYVRIKLDGVTYVAHRLAWLCVYGYLPGHEVDHKDRCRANNALKNLRKASRIQNARNKRIPPNNTSGVIGVTWHARLKKWQAQLELNGKCKHLGVHSTIEAAAHARHLAEREFFGVWAGERP